MNEDPINELVGESRSFKAAIALVRKVASSDASVLIQGETGTGKELVATAIHFHSKRKNQAFVVINCAAIPETLLESELFGYVRGAFTGAFSDHTGLFRAADKGTIFLDEVGELPLNLQAKLLRFLQEKAFMPVGGNREITVDVRVISASNQALEKLVELGSFRADLYYRICTIRILLPPLRERKEDVILLAEHFLKELAPNKNVKLASDAVDKLRAYSFPGNVRELRSIIERACIMAKGLEITAAEIDVPESNLASIFRGIKKVDFKREVETVKRLLLRDAISKHENLEDAARYLGLSWEEFKVLCGEYLSQDGFLKAEPEDEGLYNAIATAVNEAVRRGEYHRIGMAAEKALIEYLLKGHTKTAVARMLRLSPMTLYRKVRSHKINRTEREVRGQSSKSSLKLRE